MGFVLGINGPAKAGKDTVGDYLINHKGWTNKVSFAGNLKEMCKSVFNLSDYQVNDQDGKKELFPSPVRFTEDNFFEILDWISRTHPEAIYYNLLEKDFSLFSEKVFINSRDILQFVGTDVCRKYVPSYHIDIVRNRLKAKKGRSVITDCRFPNEGNLIIDELEGLVIKLDRPNNSAENINKNHLSETAMKNWPRFAEIIDNSEDGLEFLYQKVENFLRRHDL